MLCQIFRLGLLLTLLTSAVICTGQIGIYLQIEEINSTDLIRYYPGQKITFSTKEYPDTWRKSKIVNIIPEEQLIVLEEGYITPEEIHGIRRNNTGVIIFGHALSKFAAGWLAFGAYATVFDSGYKMSWTEVAIGAIAAAIGWGIRKLFSRKKYPMGKHYRVRIMDLRFPAPKLNTP